MNLLNPSSLNYNNNILANGSLFELLVSIFLEFPVTLNAMDGKNEKNHDLVLQKGNRIQIHADHNGFLNYCSSLNASSDKISPRKLIVPKEKNQPVIDLMDAKDRAYQITVGKKHGVNLRGLRNMVDLLHLDSNNPLNLYFIVLKEHFDDFKWEYEEELLDIDPKVKELEQMTVLQLKKKFKSMKQLQNGSKEVLIKRVMEISFIVGETTEDKKKNLLSSVKFFKICLPEDLPCQIEKSIMRLQERV